MVEHLAKFYDWRARVKAVDAELGIADPVKAAAVLSSRRVALPDRPVSWREIEGVLRLHGEWVRLLKRAKGSINSDPPTEVELLAQDAAMNVISLDRDQVFDPSHAEAMTTLNSGVQLFLMTKDISPETADRILGLFKVSELEFDPGPTEHDLATIRGDEAA